MSDIIKIGSSVIYKISKNGKEKVGQVRDITFLGGGIRYAIYRKEIGRFLNGKTIHYAMQNKETFVEDNRWVFFMWLKSERIIKILG